jgi:hypothetical protein
MASINCPSCNASLSPAEITEGWCESCGKKIPGFVTKGFPQAVSTSPPQERLPISDPNSHQDEDLALLLEGALAESVSNKPIETTPPTIGQENQSQGQGKHHPDLGRSSGWGYVQFGLGLMGTAGIVLVVGVLTVFLPGHELDMGLWLLLLMIGAGLMYLVGAFLCLAVPVEPGHRPHPASLDQRLRDRDNLRSLAIGFVVCLFIWLILGLILWSASHPTPSSTSVFDLDKIEAMEKKKERGRYTIIILLSLVGFVWGLLFFLFLRGVAK